VGLPVCFLIIARQRLGKDVPAAMKFLLEESFSLPPVSCQRKVGH
jgi:hypothetical protein